MADGSQAFAAADPGSDPCGESPAMVQGAAYRITDITHHIGNMVARQWAARLIAANCSHLAAPAHVYREAT
ncbi:MAG TPA: hypothetical protein VF474_16455 [Phenylobacterium sp.]